MLCLLIQPIHEDGISVLRSAGLEVVTAPDADMKTVAAKIGSAVAVITRNAGLDRAAMQAASRLRVLGIHGTGFDRIDVDYANQIGLPIVSTPTANVQSVAEHVIAQMLALAKQVREADIAVRRGHHDYRYTSDIQEMSGKVLGIVGYGRIGRRVAEIAQRGFDMTVLVHSSSVSDEDIFKDGFQPVRDLHRMLATIDVLSLHQRLTQHNRHCFDRAMLARLRPNAILINTARGALVDPDALVDAIEAGYLRGAALDVFDPEPLPATHRLANCRQIILSPHIGGATREAMSRTAINVASQIVDVLQGRKPRWIVNEHVWSRRRERQNTV